MLERAGPGGEHVVDLARVVGRLLGGRLLGLRAGRIHRGLRPAASAAAARESERGQTGEDAAPHGPRQSPRKAEGRKRPR